MFHPDRRRTAMEHAMAADGLTTIPSSYGPKDTMNRLEAAVAAKGMTVFARIDHAAGARAVGLSLRPTEVLIFGNAQAGTPLMQSAQTIGINLPLKVLVWQDISGNAWLFYNDSGWLAQRHGLSGETEAAVGIMTTALNAVATAATANALARSVISKSGAEPCRLELVVLAIAVLASHRQEPHPVGL
jgi:uncharacterized protein (DUF302 family)